MADMKHSLANVPLEKRKSALQPKTIKPHSQLRTVSQRTTQNFQLKMRGDTPERMKHEKKAESTASHTLNKIDMDGSLHTLNKSIFHERPSNATNRVAGKTKAILNGGGAVYATKLTRLPEHGETSPPLPKESEDSQARATASARKPVEAAKQHALKALRRGIGPFLPSGRKEPRRLQFIENP